MSVSIGEVHTDVTVIQEPATWISSWESIGVDTDANTLAIDSVRFEIGDPSTTTTTEPCLSATPPPTTSPTTSPHRTSHRSRLLKPGPLSAPQRRR